MNGQSNKAVVDEVVFEDYGDDGGAAVVSWW